MNEPDMPQIPEDATPIAESQKPPKLSKIQEKKQRIFQDRMQRHIAAGKTPEQAFAAINREDYDKLPLDQKIKRLEGMFIGNIQGLARDLATLKQNEVNLADVMDVNFRAFEKMLVKLGLGVAEQRQLLIEAEAEVRAEMEARKVAEAAAQKQATEDAKKGELAASIDQPAPEGAPAQMPEGASVFG